MSTELSHVIEIRKNGKWQLLKWYTTTPSWYNEKHQARKPWREAWSYLKNYKKYKTMFKGLSSENETMLEHIRSIFKSAKEEELPCYDKPIKVGCMTLYPQAVLSVQGGAFRDEYITGYGDSTITKRGIPTDCDKETLKYAGDKWNHSHTWYTLSELYGLLEASEENFKKKMKTYSDNKLLIDIAKKLEVKTKRQYIEDYTYDEWYEEHDDLRYSLNSVYNKLSGIVDELNPGFTPESDIRIITWAS